MTRAEARYRAITEAWAEVASTFGLEHEVLVPPPAEDRTGRLAQVLSGQAQGVATGSDRVAHRMSGRVDELGIVVEIRREEAMGLGGNPTVHVVTRYRAEAAWLPKGVRVANRHQRRTLRRAHGGAPGLHRLHLARATHLTALARDPESAAVWLDERRVDILRAAMTARPDLQLVGRAVRAAAKGEESDPRRLADTLTAVVELAHALR